jgi:hypothetical protein
MKIGLLIVAMALSGCGTSAPPQDNGQEKALTVFNECISAMRSAGTNSENGIPDCLHKAWDIPDAVAEDDAPIDTDDEDL